MGMTNTKPNIKGALILESLESRILMTGNAISADDAFPFVSWGQWTYDVTQNGQTAIVQADMDFWGGNIASITRSSSHPDFLEATETFQRESEGIYLTSQEVLSAEIDLDGILFLPDQLVPGQRFSSKGTFFIDYVGVDFSGTSMGSGKVGKWTKVTVPAGTFQAIKVTYSWSVSGAAYDVDTIFGTYDILKYRGKESDVMYFSPGIGLVKKTQSASVKISKLGHQSVKTEAELRATDNLPDIEPSLPNLEVDQVKYKANAFDPQKQFGISVKNLNSGLADVPSSQPFEVSAILSKDRIWGNNDDIPLESAVESRGIDAGKVLNMKLTGQLQSTPPPGSYYVGIQIDSGGAVEETSETDNTWWAASPDIIILGPEVLDLYSVSFAGPGQVTMYKQGSDSWDNDLFGEKGNKSIGSGLNNPIWVDNNHDGDAFDSGDENDPLAFVSGSKIQIGATFHVKDQYNGLYNKKSVQVCAVDVEDGVVFMGSGKIKQDEVAVTLKCSQSSKITESLIQNRPLEMQWEISTDRGQTSSFWGSTEHKLFVTYGKPTSLSAAPEAITAQRMNYVTDLATRNTDPADLKSMVDAIAVKAQSRFNYTKPDTKKLGEEAWSFLDTLSPMICVESSWLQVNELSIIGLDAEVRFVFPRTGKWTRCWSTRDDGQQYNNEGENLGYIEVNPYDSNKLLFHDYEACCYVSTPLSYQDNGRLKKGLYYGGGMLGASFDSAAEVLRAVTGANSQWEGAQQYWFTDNWVDDYKNGRNVELPPLPAPTD
jgi:hypothetical protein